MITSQKAKLAIEASETKARELGIAVTTTIVDDGGNVIAVSRMDNAIIISTKFAFAKAYTSASLGMPSGKIAEFASEGKPYFGINSLFNGKLTTMAGGIPVIANNKLIGGIGVGGSQDPNQDELCAKEAAAVLAS